MTDKEQPDALELASAAESADLVGYPTAKKANAYYLCLLEDCAQMIRKLHAELEALRADVEHKDKCIEQLGRELAAECRLSANEKLRANQLALQHGMQSKMRSEDGETILALKVESAMLQRGYAAARLEIESLRAEVETGRRLLREEMQRRVRMAQAAQPAGAHQPGADYAALPDVDALAQEIRRVDGGHNLGAGALAEALMPFLRASHWQAPAQAAAQQPRQIEECYGDCPTNPATCPNPCNFGGRATRAPHGQAPAQASPAAVAGSGGYGPKVTVKRRCSDCKACNSESYAVQGDSGHYVYCEHPSLPERKYIGDTNWNTPHWCPVSAPTTQPAPQQGEGRNLQAVINAAADKLDAAKRCHQNAVDTLIDEALEILDGDRDPHKPAPQQEPILYDPKALLEAFQNAQAGSSSPAGTLRGIAAVIASWESRTEPHTWLIAAPQPSLAAQVDALDAAMPDASVAPTTQQAPQQEAQVDSVQGISAAFLLWSERQGYSISILPCSSGNAPDGGIFADERTRAAWNWEKSAHRAVAARAAQEGKSHGR